MDLALRFRRHLARRGALLSEWWWVPLFYTLAVIWIYRGVWDQQGLAMGFGWDAVDSYGPDLDFFASDLAHGRFSLWNPYDKGGYPLFCDPQFDRYYPFAWPFAAFGAVFGTAWWTIQVKILAHHVAAAACMHLFLRARGLSVRASLVGGLALIASTPLLVHKASILIWPLVWVPLIWASIDWLLAAPSWRRGAAAGGAFTLCATAASPPGVFYAMLMVAPYAIWRFAMALRERRQRDDLIRLAIALGVLAIIAGLVLAITVLPARELVPLSARDRFAPPGKVTALSASLPLWGAVRGVFVRGAGVFEVYMGAATMLLAFCALVRPRFDRGIVIVFFVTAAFGIVLSAGLTAPVLPWLVDHVQVFGLLRVPGRYKLVATWPLAACAAFGAAALGDARVRTRVTIVAAASAVVAIWFVRSWPNAASLIERPPWWSIPIALLAAALVVASVWWRRAADGAIAALTIIVLFDAPLFMFVLPNAPPAAEPRRTHERDAEIVPALVGTRDRFRIYDEFVLGERAGARLRLRDFRGYPAVDPLSLQRYVEVLDYAKRTPAILTDFNVRWLLKAPHFRYSHSTSFAEMPDPAFIARGGGLWEAKYPAPLVQWVSAIVIAPRHKVLAALRAVEEPDGARRRAVLEPDDAARVPDAKRLVYAPPASREGTLISYAPDEIRVAVTAPSDGIVVLNEIMFPGWHVDVDGTPARPVRANYLLRAVAVGPGAHTITWRYEPARWRWLVVGYVLALAIMLAALVLRRRKHLDVDIGNRDANGHE